MGISFHGVIMKKNKNSNKVGSNKLATKMPLIDIVLRFFKLPND
jgi:hypothetical protein